MRYKVVKATHSKGGNILPITQWIVWTTNKRVRIIKRELGSYISHLRPTTDSTPLSPHSQSLQGSTTDQATYSRWNFKMSWKYAFDWNIARIVETEDISSVLPTNRIILQLYRLYHLLFSDLEIDVCIGNSVVNFIEIYWGKIFLRHY